MCVYVYASPASHYAQRRLCLAGVVHPGRPSERPSPNDIPYRNVPLHTQEGEAKKHFSCTVFLFRSLVLPCVKILERGLRRDRITAPERGKDGIGNLQPTPLAKPRSLRVPSSKASSTLTNDTTTLSYKIVSQRFLDVDCLSLFFCPIASETFIFWRQRLRCSELSALAIYLLSSILLLVFYSINIDTLSIFYYDLQTSV